MNFPDNKVSSIFEYLLNGLIPTMEESEARNIAVIAFDFLFQMSRVDLVLKAEDRMGESDILKVHKLLKRLRNFEPIQYITGKTEFYGLDLIVGPDVLIPRPETEELVHTIIQEYSKMKDLQILDCCTGSACIALALKSALNADVYACDISKNALEIASKNAEKNNLLVNLFICDLLNEFPMYSSLDVIVSNPPYIPKKEYDTLERHVRDFEPSIALEVSNEDPIIFYQRIAQYAAGALKINGRLFFEIHQDFSAEVGEMLFNLEFEEINVMPDMQGNDRIISAKKGS